MEIKRRQVLKRPLLFVLALLCLIWVFPAMQTQAMELTPGSLVVELASGQSDWQEDIESAGAAIDLYQVAKAENNTPEDAGYKFTLNDAFSSVDLDEEAEIEREISLTFTSEEALEGFKGFILTSF